MEKYGFVYIWRDRKHKRYYIGSHWGLESDGYLCSSNWMRDAYRRRPHDFKRRILARVHTSKQDLLVEEGKWLALIPKEEIGKRYYNLLTSQPGHWTATESSLSIKEKIKKKSQEFWAEHPEAREVASEKTLRYFEEHPEARDRVGEKSLEFYRDPKNREATGRERREYFSNSDVREAASERTSKYFEVHPEARAAVSERSLRYHEDHPEVREKHSIYMKKYYEDNPELLKVWVEGMIEYWSDPEVRGDAKERALKYWSDPEARGDAKERALKYWSDPNTRKEQRDRVISFYRVHPEAGKKHGDRIKAQWEKVPLPEHGTSARYTCKREGGNCRCPLCKSAMAEYRISVKEKKGSVKHATLPPI